jgi:ABC-type Fe3+-siderophore transport system permease subunit
MQGVARNPLADPGLLGVDALALGDDVARSLGQRVGVARAFSALSVVLLCGAATAAAGRSPSWA